jgi:hypothetical protein
MPSANLSALKPMQLNMRTTIGRNGTIADKSFGGVRSLLAVLLLLLGGSWNSVVIRAEVPRMVGAPIYSIVNSHAYVLLTPASWQESESSAESLGGNLASIRSQAEQDWIWNTFGGGTNSPRSLWIGLRREFDGGPFSWVNGEPFSFANWFAGFPQLGWAPEPNNAFGDENYVIMVREGYSEHVPPGAWNDLRSPNIHFQAFEPVQAVVELLGNIPEAPLRISITQTPDQGSVEVQYPANPYSYYVLYSASTVSAPWVPIAEALYSDPLGSFAVGVASSQQYFLLRRVSIFAPENVLRDGIDDLFKLMNGLDPLLAGTAEVPSGHRDSVGRDLSWLQYYQQVFGRNLVGGEYYSREISTFNFGLPAAKLEAISREISLYNGQLEPFGSKEQETYGREVSIFNFGIPAAPEEAISREVSVYNGQMPLVAKPQETYSREVSVFNTGESPGQASYVSHEVSAFNFGLPTAPLEAISRELSVYNQ